MCASLLVPSIKQIVTEMENQVITKKKKVKETDTVLQYFII